jgi:hypothetical protein
MNLEARAIVTRLGDEGDCKWKVVIQVRNPNADFDAVYTVGWLGETPPAVDEVLRAYAQQPEAFTFLDFLPNLNKQPRSPSHEG